MPTTSTPPAFATALLIGGMSRRMGQDKALLDWHGQPLWQHQLDKLRALAPAQLLISCRKDQTIDAPDAQRIIDPIIDQGPIPALQRCLGATSLPLLVLAVDLPHIPIHFLQHLLHLHQTSPTQGIIFKNNTHYEPLCAIYPPSILPLLPQHQRLQTLAQQAINSDLLHTQQLTSTQQTYFLNLNTPADLTPTPPPHV